MEQGNSPIDFSLLLPVYNAESFLVSTLNSISEIEYHDFEVIIINDGSTDKSKSICLDFCEKFEKFKYYENVTNIGLIKTLNKGLLLVKGKFIVRADSDDLLHKSILKEYANKIDGLGENTNFILTSKSYYIKGKRIVKPTSRYNVLSKNIQKILFLENQINHPSSCFPNYNRNNILYGDENYVKYFEDLDLWVRMVNRGYNIVTTNSRYLYYRVHEDSVTKKSISEKVILKKNYLLKSELNTFFSLDEIALIAGDKELEGISFFPFESNLMKYINSKEIDLDLKAWLLFYLLNLYKKTHKHMTFVSSCFLILLIIKHFMLNTINPFIYKHCYTIIFENK